MNTVRKIDFDIQSYFVLAKKTKHLNVKYF